MAWPFAACSNRRYGMPAFRNISVPITIRCVGFISGKRTYGFWRSAKLKQFPVFRSCIPSFERLIGTVRRECLDQFLFWSASDLELKLFEFKEYYNKYRAHSALQGNTPSDTADGRSID